jgi:hypothetical protein
MEHVDYAYTRGMSDEEVEQRLKTAETGVLALCDEGDARAIPVAHYYDGDRLYFRLGRTAGSEKWEAIESAGTVTYVVYEATPTDAPEEIESWSVHAMGRLRELPEAERNRFDTAAINERFSPIRVFDEAIEDIEVVILELVVESLAGRTTTLA